MPTKFHAPHILKRYNLLSLIMNMIWVTLMLGLSTQTRIVSSFSLSTQCSRLTIPSPINNALKINQPFQRRSQTSQLYERNSGDESDEIAATEKSMKSKGATAQIDYSNVKPFTNKKTIDTSNCDPELLKATSETYAVLKQRKVAFKS